MEDGQNRGPFTRPGGSGALRSRHSGRGRSWKRPWFLGFGREDESWVGPATLATLPSLCDPEVVSIRVDCGTFGDFIHLRLWPSSIWVDERSGRTVRPARTCVRHWQSPASSPGPSPAVGGGGGLFWRSGKESWTKSAAASSALTGWSRPERSSQSLAQVSPAAAPVLAEEVCKEGASKEKPESETPPAALAACARTTAR